MTKLFWVCWILDLLILVFNLWATGFREGFGAGTGLNAFVTLALIAVLVTALLCKVYSSIAWLPVGVAALPLLGLLIAYVVDSLRNP